MTLDQYIHYLEKHPQAVGFQKQLDQLLAQMDPQVIAQHLGLVFLKEDTDVNVCYLNSPEVRAEFRQSFFTSDIADYIYAVVYGTQHNGLLPDSIKIPYPENVETFWQLVEVGRELRELGLVKENQI